MPAVLVPWSRGNPCYGRITSYGNGPCSGRLSAIVEANHVRHVGHGGRRFQLQYKHDQSIRLDFCVDKERHRLIARCCPEFANGSTQLENTECLKKLLPGEKAVRVALNNPSLLWAPLSSWFDFLRAYGFQDADLARLIETTPNIFVHGSVYNAGQVLSYLQGLGCEPRELIAIVTKRWPALLTLSTSQQIHPAVSYLEQLGCGRHLIKKLVCKQPRWLCCSVDSDLVPRISILTQAGLNLLQLSQVVPPCVETIILEPTHALAAKVQFLAGCGFAQQKLAQLLTGCPEILSNSISSLNDRWQFLVEVMGGRVEDVLGYPRYLDTDLSCIIRPRYFFIRDHHLEHKLTLPGSSRVSLSLLLSGTDDEFQTATDVSRSQYLEFYNQLVSMQHYGVKFQTNINSKQM